MSFKYELGLKVRDILTNFEGVIIYRVEYATGCNQYGIQQQVSKSSKTTEQLQVDENRIEVLGVNKKVTELVAQKNKPSSTPVKGGPNTLIKY